MQRSAAARDARADGYRLALDDFAAGDEYDAFLRLANVVKVDVLGATPDHLRALSTRLKRYHVTLLAERIEDGRNAQPVPRARVLALPGVLLQPPGGCETARTLVRDDRRRENDEHDSQPADHDGDLEEGFRSDPDSASSCCASSIRRASAGRGSTLSSRRFA